MLIFICLEQFILVMVVFMCKLCVLLRRCSTALVGLQLQIRVCYGWFYVQIVCFVGKMFNDATPVGLQVQVRREVGKEILHSYISKYS